MDSIDQPAREARVTSSYIPAIVIWPMNEDFDDDDRRAHFNEMREIRTEIATKGEGVVVIRDNPAGLGPEAVDVSIVRRAIADNCLFFFLIVGEPPLLPVEEQGISDDLFSSEQAERQKPGRWSAYVFCTPASASRWLAYIEFRNPDAWVARIDREGSRVVKVGAKPNEEVQA